jgi:hypothetical protein
MAQDPRKRQKKIERRHAKEKSQRRELARRESGGVPARLREASTAPILHCLMLADLWHHGIGPVLVSRLLRNGEVAYAYFLVDVWCVGVKDLILGVSPRPIYEEKIYDKLVRQGMVKLRPECARKLIEGAVQYALDLGLPPHADYRVGKLIFGDISAEACSETFTYGRDGKPLFVAGPYDTAARCEQILRTLENRTGPEGHHFVIPGEGTPPGGLFAQ